MDHAMLMESEMLKTAEAAIVANVEPSYINRAIDENILPSIYFRRENGRSVRADACALIAFYAETANLLTAEMRREMINSLIDLQKLMRREGSAPDMLIHEGVVTVDFGPILKRTREALERLSEARDMVVISPEILGGTPVIKGTRVPVYDVAAVAAQVPIDEVLKDYPSLSADQVDLAKLYAKANPLRGRPKMVMAPPEKAVIRASYKVTRSATSA